MAGELVVRAATGDTLGSRQKANAAKVARTLGVTTTTLCTYVNGDGSPKAAGQALLDAVVHGSGAWAQ